MARIVVLLAFLPKTGVAAQTDTLSARVQTVTNIPGCIAFWDFVKREPAPPFRFTAHVPSGSSDSYALDPANYVRDYWGQGREATYADFPLLGRGPFGEAIRIRNESDPMFRPLLMVPRSRLHDSPLDIKGPGRSLTLVVWAVRESGNHALAGIWHEGTDLKQGTTTNIQRVVRGQRQYGLFAGLNKPGAACAHVSENGAGSFAYKYAMHKANSGDISPMVSGDSPAPVLDNAWQCIAMTFDCQKHELTAWLNGCATESWQEDVKQHLPPVYNAWMQAELRNQPGIQPGEDPAYPSNQLYHPPEGRPKSIKILRESHDERVELQEFPFTGVTVTLRRDTDGKFIPVARDLSAVRLNPWWFPYALYAPPDPLSGAPFTIGRVVHSSRSVGFTGWIGGVAVFNRAITPDEMAKLAALAHSPVRPP